MDVTNTYNTAATLAPNKSDQDRVVANPKGVLGKDDFLKLLLIELQYQDPTDPMDSEKILTQTSELASLEAADNTKKTLEHLTKTLSQSSGLSALSAIGKIGTLGNDTILLDEENRPTFDLYLPSDAQSGTLKIEDIDGHLVKSFTFGNLPAGVNAFSWDGTDDAGNRAPVGSYRIVAEYTTPTGAIATARYGSLPIESVRFEKGEAEVKMGSHYYPIDRLKEISEG